MSRILALALLLTGCPAPHDTSADTGAPSGEVTIAQIAEEDAEGHAVLAGQVVTTRGIATAASGVLGGRKLRIHLQADGAGCAVDADEVVAAEIVGAIGDLLEGDELLITGLVTQQDLASNEDSAVEDGLTRVRIEDSTRVVRLSAGNPLPEPLGLSLPDILAGGDTWEGLLVRLDDVHKVAQFADTWVTSLDSSTVVDVQDADGAGPLKVRLGNGERTGGYGDDPGTAAFSLIGLLREDTTNPPESDPDGSSFEVWPRSEDDIL
ncbi:MAG: hypothetical protein ABIO70_33425 [Pseudomonadota bacterium]